MLYLAYTLKHILIYILSNNVCEPISDNITWGAQHSSTWQATLGYTSVLTFTEIHFKS